MPKAQAFDTPGDIGGPRPSDFHCEPGVHAAGFGSLVQLRL